MVEGLGVVLPLGACVVVSLWLEASLLLVASLFTLGKTCRYGIRIHFKLKFKPPNPAYWTQVCLCLCGEGRGGEGRGGGGDWELTDCAG